MDENDKGVSRRRALTILGLGGAVVATVALPSKWTRPLVESIVVPAHAQASGGGGGGNGGSSTTTQISTTIIKGTQISDVRLKEEIAPVGRLGNGLGLYRFRYKWSDTVYVGVMAQEALTVHPDAVVAGAGGFLRVDYDRIGFRMVTWDEWTGAGKAHH